MITLKELNKHNYLTTPEILAAMSKLIERLNVVLFEAGIQGHVNSGLRTLASQMQINPNAPKSKHLTGHAVDIADPDQKLQTWCYDNVERLEDLGLWCEAFQFTPNWVHFQDLAPRSGHRFFIP